VWFGGQQDDRFDAFVLADTLRTDRVRLSSLEWLGSGSARPEQVRQRVARVRVVCDARGEVFGDGLGPLAGAQCASADHDSVDDLPALRGQGPDLVLAQMQVAALAVDDHIPARVPGRHGHRHRDGIGLVPVATVLGGGLWFPADEAAGSAAVVPVLRVLREVLADAPDTLTVTAGTVGLPYLDAVPEALRGRHVLHVRLVSTLATPSARAAAEDALTRLRAAGTTLAEDVREMPWSDSGEIVGEPPWAHAYDGTDVLVTDLSAEDLGTLVERAGPGTGVVLDVRPLGGAFARRPHVPDAVSFRHADFVVRVISVTDGTGADRDTVRAAHDHVLSALYELDDRVLGRAAAFLYGRARAEAVPEELWDPATLVELRRVRAVHDPRGVFSGGDLGGR